MYKDLIEIILARLKRRKGKNSYTEETIRRKIEILNKYLSYSDILKLTKNPEIFTLSEEILVNRIHYLESIFGKDIVSRAPSLLTYEPATIEEKIRDLIQIFGKSREEIINLIKRFPKILTYSYNNIQEKINLISNKLKIDGRELIYENPRILSRSLKTIEEVIDRCGKNVLEKPSLFYKSEEYVRRICDEQDGT